MNGPNEKIAFLVFEVFRLKTKKKSYCNLGNGVIYEFSITLYHWFRPIKNILWGNLVFLNYVIIELSYLLSVISLILQLFLLQCFNQFCLKFPSALELVSKELNGGHFVCLCREFNFYEVKKYYYFLKRKGKYFYTFNHLYSEKSSKRAK